jgi:1,4-alpha-glucan branching enzyme
MSIEKKYLKSKSVCKVTFRVPKESVGEAEKVSLVGEFNNWDGSIEVMQALKDGSFKTTLDLDSGKEYQFRYLIDGNVWVNDDLADKFVPSGISAELNSVVVL